MCSCKTINMSSGIRELLGFQFWVDNAKRRPLEALLQQKIDVPRDRAAILRELEEESRAKGPGSPESYRPGRRRG